MEATIGGTRRHVVDLVGGLARAGVDVGLVAAAEREPAFRADLTRLAGQGVRVHELPMVRSLRPARDYADLQALRGDPRARAPRRRPHPFEQGRRARPPGLGVERHRPARAHAAHLRLPLRRHVRRPAAPALPPDRDGPRGAHRASDRGQRRARPRRSCASGVVDPARVRVVANGIDPAPWRAARPAQLALAPRGRPRSLVVGLLNVAKGQDLAIEALALPGLERAHLLLAGHGEERAALERAGAASSASPSARTSSAGATTCPRCSPRPTSCCVPSRWEGMPYVVLEAMAARRPVVATPVDGARELVDEEHRRARAAEDPAALAAAARAAPGAPSAAERAALGARGARARRARLHARRHGRRARAPSTPRSREDPAPDHDARRRRRRDAPARRRCAASARAATQVRVAWLKGAGSLAGDFRRGRRRSRSGASGRRASSCGSSPSCARPTSCTRTCSRPTRLAALAGAARRPPRGPRVEQAQRRAGAASARWSRASTACSGASRGARSCSPTTCGRFIARARPRAGRAPAAHLLRPRSRAVRGRGREGPERARAARARSSASADDVVFDLRRALRAAEGARRAARGLRPARGRASARLKLLLVGDDPFGDGRQRAEQLARELDLGGAVHLRRHPPRRART